MSPVSRETAGGAPALPPSFAAGVARETAPRRVATAVVLAPIRAYRRFLSPLLGARCRYYPTCSSYAEQAVRELGPLRGTIVAAWRVLRCNPMSSGGLDPLENRRLFRSQERARPAEHDPTTS